MSHYNWIRMYFPVRHICRSIYKFWMASDRCSKKFSSTITHLFSFYI